MASRRRSKQIVIQNNQSVQPQPTTITIVQQTPTPPVQPVVVQPVPVGQPVAMGQPVDVSQPVVVQPSTY
jgi:hypothetical protein